MANPIYDVTAAFEKALCNYTGAPYCATVDNQSNALFLCMYYEGIRGREVIIPDHTYPSVPNEVIHAGGKVVFIKTNSEKLKGAYRLGNTKTVDSALRFTYNMYKETAGLFVCLSFTGPYKHLKIGKGGAILTDDPDAYAWFKRARFSGRREMPYNEDNLDMLGWNFYLLPDLAIKGLRDMAQFYTSEGKPIPQKDKELRYPDLSKFPIYTKANR
jgi:dTDP-4-amino-4,6-dideoxygalactose transaminase